MEAPNRAQIKLMVTEDMMFRAPLWALLIMALWGTICFVMLWTLLNVIKPSIDRRIEEAKSAALVINSKSCVEN